MIRRCVACYWPLEDHEEEECSQCIARGWEQDLEDQSYDEWREELLKAEDLAGKAGT